MFSSVISSTPFVTDIASRIFDSKIFGYNYGSDVSFISTLRALLHGRIGEETLSFYIGNQHAYYVRSNFDVKGAQLGSIYDSSIKLMDLQTDSPEELERWFQAIDKHLGGVYQSFHFVRVDKIEQFFRRAFQVRCYIDMERRSVLLLVGGLDRKKYHYLQCAIPAFLPWYFDPANGLTELEKALIESLRCKEPDAYLQCLEKIAETLNFRDAQIKSVMTGFESAADKESLQEAQSNIEYYSRKIREYTNSINECIRKQYELQTKAMGLQARIAEKDGKDSDLMRYFLSNKRLTPVSVSGSVLRFIVADYLEYVDETMAETFINNRNSYLYDFGRGVGSHTVSDEAIRAFLKALLLDRMIRMRMCACYDLDLRGGIDARDGYPFGSEYSGYMPNPHIQYYACMGGFVNPINECLQRHDYIAAVENCVSSAISLSIGDGTVVTKFLRNMFDGDGVSYTCIEMPDGRYLTPIAAAKELIAAQEG